MSFHHWRHFSPATASPMNRHTISSNHGGRRSSNGAGKTPDRSWEASRSSDYSSNSIATASSAGRSSDTGRISVKSVVRAFSSCFTAGSGQTETESTSRRTSLSFEINSSTGSKHGMSQDNMRRSVKGLSSGLRRDSEDGHVNTKFSMAEIVEATKNFSAAMIIGQGGFGTVYKGKLADGTLVAVKRSKKNAPEMHISSEFQSEVKILGQIQHNNLVTLYGYFAENNEKLIVVEYVANGTLREHLDGLRGKHLDLSARLDVATDVAHAVTYLHMYADCPIIHRDIKSSNVLLTEHLRAKVADFGFARLGIDDSDVTHISTQVKGTAGYLDPEYLKTYQLTNKSDVYSFGVLLVEIISGRRPIELKRKIQERVTPKWAMKKFSEGNSIEILDPNLLPCTPATNLALEKILELAFRCLSPTRQNRPSMQRCCEILWNIRKDYRELLSSDVTPLESCNNFTSIPE